MEAWKIIILILLGVYMVAMIIYFYIFEPNYKNKLQKFEEENMLLNSTNKVLANRNKLLNVTNEELVNRNKKLSQEIIDLQIEIRAIKSTHHKPPTPNPTIKPDEIREQKPIRILKVTFKCLVSKEKKEEKLCEILRHIHDYGIIHEDPTYTITEIDYTPVNVITCDFNIKNIMNFENLSQKEE